MNHSITRLRRRGQRGIALLEALLAVVLLAIGLLGTIGMQARAYSALSDAGMRAEASIATERLFGEMNNDQLNLADYAVAASSAPSARLTPWFKDTTDRIPGAVISIDVAAAGAGMAATKVDVLIKWTRKTGGKQNQHRVVSYISTGAS